MSLMPVIIVDDDMFARHQMASIVRHTEGLVLEAVVGSFEALRILCQNRKPAKGVLLLDLDFRGQDKDGVFIAEYILKHYPDLHIIVLTVDSTERQAEYLLRRGVMGMLLKSDAPALIYAIKQVRENHRYASPPFKHLLYDAPTRVSTKTGFDLLAMKEKRVLEGVHKGFSSADIASLLHISINSVYVYKSRAIKKLGLKNEVDLVAYLQRYFTNTVSVPDVFNLDYGAKLFNGDTKRAMDTLMQCVETLPEIVTRFKQYAHQHDYVSLLTDVHRFYGGLCFTGAVELQEAVLALLVDLQKKQYGHIDKQMNVVLGCIKRLMAYVQHN